MNVSLVIPIKNEEDSFTELFDSILNQKFPPDEVIFVDGGSTDQTVNIVENAILGRNSFKLVKQAQASPGRGRNIGTEYAENEWIAYTDAGIQLTREWLANLVDKANSFPRADIVYGNFAPVTRSYFEKIAAIAYVAPQKPDNIRVKSVASCLLKKAAWKKVGGFPDLRAAEDLMFMESLKNQGFEEATAPDALVYWKLRPTLSETFKKFTLYSKHNVWAGRAYDWHYGIAKQYVLMAPFVLLAVLHSWLWLGVIVLWLAARAAKRILAHKYEFGLSSLFNPIVFCGVIFVILTIDAATFYGWLQAIFSNK